MARRKDLDQPFSRRAFLGRMRWAPILFLPAPLEALAFRSLLGKTGGEANPSLDFADLRVRPHYPTNSPLDDVLEKVTPGTDAFVTEKYAFEILRLLDEWSRGLKAGPPASRVLAKFLDASLEACSLVPGQQTSLRSGYGIDVFRKRFATDVVLGRERSVAGLLQALQHRVDGGEAVRVFLVIETNGGQPLANLHGRQRFPGVPQHEPARVGQPEGHRRREPAQLRQRANRLVELRDPRVKRGAIGRGAFVVLHGRVERAAVVVE